MTLRGKVLLPFVLIGLMLLLVLYGYWMPRYVIDLKHEYKNATERHLASVMEGLVPLLLAHQLDVVYENLDALKQRNTNWLSIRLLDADGRTLYPLSPGTAASPGGDVRTIEQPIGYDDANLGRLVVDVDFDEPVKDLRTHHLQMLALTAVILLLSMGAIWFSIERMVSRPVADLAQASRRLAEGDFTTPLPPVGRDEVGELVRSFDRTRSALQVFQTELLRRNESLVKLSHAIEQSPVSIVMTDSAGHVEFVNPRFCEVTGYSAAEVLGRHLREFKVDEASSADMGTIWETVAGGSVWRGEFRSIRKNGEVLWQSASLTAVRNESGDMTHAIAILEDISERRALEEQLRQAQKMEAVGLLTGGISHDFNNILAAIIGYGSFIRMKMAPNDVLRPSVEEILHAAERAATLIRSLLTFSKKQVVNPRPVDVNELVGRMKGMLSRLIREDIELVTVLDRAPLMVFIDPGQLEQIIFNLVTNARDAMPKGGTLIIEAERTVLTDQLLRKHGETAGGQHVMLSISDTGMGMDAQIQERMYEPFFTTKEQGKGTGLGLSTVYGIVNQNNGHISCYSVPDKGTTFKVYFPLIASPEREQPAEPKADVMRGTETVLVAEDDEAVRNYTRTILQEAGYRVLTAANGEETVVKFREQPDAVDILLLDVVMPKKSGSEVYEEVRRLRSTVRVLFTSGYTAEMLEQKGIVSGELKVLSKPCTPIELLRMVREVLDAPVPSSSA